MTRQLQSRNSHITLEVGKTYWLYMVQLNGKRSGLKRNVKPFEVILTKMDNSVYLSQNQNWWDPGCFDWDLSNNIKYKKTSNSVYDIYHQGVICDTYDEAKAGYNLAIEEVTMCGSWNSCKFTEDYKEGKIKGVLKHKIK